MYNLKICEKIFDLIHKNVYASSSPLLERALKNRFVGFRAELDLVNCLLSKEKILREGGYFVPTVARSPTLSRSIYFTVDDLDASCYEAFYKTISKIKFERMFYIRILHANNFSDWTEADIDGFLFPLPEFEMYVFQDDVFLKVASDPSMLTIFFKPKEKRFVQQINVSREVKQYCISLIEQFDAGLLLHLYCSRLIFDGFLGLSFYKGIPSDIDLIIIGKQNEFILVEIKEKDVSKSSPRGFGVDVRRLEDCLQIAAVTELEYLYIVRHVNNQRERKFIEWKWMAFKKFHENVDYSKIKIGGVGMGTISTINPTVVLEFKHFNSLFAE